MDPALEELLETEREVVEAVLLTRPGAEPPNAVRVVARFGDVVTCRLARERVREVWSHPTTVSLKAARPFHAGDEVAPDLAGAATADVELDGDTEILPSDERRPSGLDADGAGCVVAVLDWGFDVFHGAFRAADGRTRVLALWDQTADGGEGPEPYGYGRVHEREEIDAAADSPTPYAALGYHPGVADRGGRGAHGT
ncbi:MAG TPA: hypothetical protein VJP77_00360, partial [Planctomycetota bacterium]|nr:hypothetical protein [Planctomycetota bacterium]